MAQFFWTDKKPIGQRCKLANTTTLFNLFWYIFIFWHKIPIILYFDYISLQVQDLVEDSETAAIEEAETETKIDDLEESDMDANDIESKTNVSYVLHIILF